MDWQKTWERVWNVLKEPETRSIVAWFATGFMAVITGVFRFLMSRKVTEKSKDGLTSAQTPVSPIEAIDPLPPRARPLVGRDDELAILLNTLTSRPALPAVVLGGPGYGKSTLCTEAWYNDDIKKIYARLCYANLDTVDTPDALIARLRDNLGISAKANPLNQVKEEIERTPTILFLDHLETCWLKDPPKTEAILSSLAEVQTSTFICALRGRESPHGARWGARIDLPPLSYDNSRKLFIETSTKHERSMDNNALDTIIRSMDGIPLAIVLMARRAQTDELPELATQWAKKRTEILRFGTTPGRYSSIEVSVELSLSDPRMDERSRRLVRILGTLPIGLENDDLNAILPDTGMEAKHTLITTGIAIPTISALPGGDHEIGIRLLSPVRYYIEARHPPDMEDRKLVSSYFLNLANQAARIGWEDGQNVQETMFRKSSNIESLLQAHLSSKEQSEALYAVRATIAYARYQRFAGVGTYDLLAQARRVVEECNDKSLQAACHLALGSMKVMRSLPAAAKIHFENAKSLYITQNDIVGIAHCLRGLGYVELVTFNYASAKARYEDATRKYQSTKDEGANQKSWPFGKDVEHRELEIERGIAECTFRIGTIIQDSTLRHDEAEGLYKRALHIHEHIGDVLGQAHCLKRLADVAMSKYSGDEAEKLYRSANELYRKAPYIVGMADCSYSLGDLLFKRGEFGTAETYYADASDLYTRASSDHGQVNCLSSQADLELCRIFGAPGMYESDRKRLYDIERKYERARSLYESLHDGIGMANCDSGMSDIKHLQGDKAAAENLFGRAHDVVRRCFNKEEDVAPAMALENGLVRRWRS